MSCDPWDFRRTGSRRPSLLRLPSPGNARLPFSGRTASGMPPRPPRGRGRAEADPGDVLVVLCEEIPEARNTIRTKRIAFRLE